MIMITSAGLHVFSGNIRLCASLYGVYTGLDLDLISYQRTCQDQKPLYNLKCYYG